MRDRWGSRPHNRSVGFQQGNIRKALWQNKRQLSPRYQVWIDVRKRNELSHAHIQMARELGMNPKKFGKFDNQRQETWEAPLPIFIENLFYKSFGKERPELAVHKNELFRNIKTTIHEAKKFASMIDDPKKVTESQMETWMKKFDAWDICDCCCSSLFVKTPFAYKKIFEWCNRKEEYEKRAAFTLMLHLVFHDFGIPQKFKRISG